MTRQEALKAIEKYGSQTKAARGLHITRHQIHAALVSEAPAPARCGRTLSEFRAAYDKATIVPARIRAALKALGKTGWEYEAEFAKAAGLSLQDLGRFRDQFADYVVSIGRSARRAWAGHTTTAQRMRDML
jgi:hypothetical protein